MNGLPPDIEKAVERHIASGLYSNAEEVIRAAMKSLDTPELESLRKSLADEAAGRVKTLKDVSISITEELDIPDSE